MTKMCDDRERACPLCAEEMDLTDQQLKPCKCGYEICVWCWHHVMEMAEKEDTEGRCPACRTAYDKERIVGTAANCERVVAELTTEKKQKSQKPKSKPSIDDRKHLSTVRVIQRNLVYVVGLPSNLCDENLLQRREYFGQYGRVLKVSISRPAGAAGQQTFNNNTFSVYITYALEEEAVRCIQAVHNFVLEGKPLRACFGTTKYCHAWLRNMNCSNPDCMYLHDIGSQEDSFTKDEIISAYTRSRVPQVASNDLQRRAGDLLPPPVDDVYNSGASSGRHQVKNGPVNNVGQSIVPSNSSIMLKTNGLPPAASWGLRVSNGPQLPRSTTASQCILKQKAETANASNLKSSSVWHDDLATSKTKVGQFVHNDRGLMYMERTCSSGNNYLPDEAHETSFDQCEDHITSAWDDDEFIQKPVEYNSKSVGVSVQSAEPVQQRLPCTTSLPVVSFRSSETPLSSTSLSSSGAVGNTDGIINPTNSGVAEDGMTSGHFGSPAASLSNEIVDSSRAMDGLCSGLSSLNATCHLEADELVSSSHSSDSVMHPIVDSGSHHIVDSESPSLTNASVSADTDTIGQSYDLNFALRKQDQQSSANNIGLNDHKHGSSNATLALMQPSCSSELPSIAQCYDKSSRSSNLGAQAEDTSYFRSQRKSIIATSHINHKLSLSMPRETFRPSDGKYSIEKAKFVDVFDSTANVNKSASVETGEYNISDMLSLDFDPWDDSLSAANNFARLLGETGMQGGSSKQPNSWRSQSSKQSRFSFARDDDDRNIVEPPIQETDDTRSLSSSRHDVHDDRLLSNGFRSPTATASSNTIGLSDSILGDSKSKISAPPGFSVPNRAPPPGFSTQDQLIGDSPLRKQQQSLPAKSADDVEFIDPAILAVGKGSLPLGAHNAGINLVTPFPTQFNSFENDPRLQLLMQQPFPTQPNLKFSEHPGDGGLRLNDSYTSLNLLAQNNSISSFGPMTFQHPRSLQMSTNRWDSWTDIQMANHFGLSENMRNDRFRLNKYFQGNEEQKFHMASSGNIYSRAFGM